MNPIYLLYSFFSRTYKSFLYLSLLFLILILPCPPVFGLNLLADLVQPVSTEFGIYTPFPVKIQPDVQAYSVAADFSNVANFSQFTFTDAEKALLAKNGFVVTPSNYGAMHDVYQVALEENLPIFVSVDLMLHAFHELFDYTLRTLETERFFPDLSTLTQSLLEASRTQMEQAGNPLLTEAALHNIAYFATAAKLLNPDFAVPADVQPLVDAELVLIRAHAGKAKSPLFGYDEDYSQYVPRGHYTLSEELRRYFLAMMWYGRMMFRADDLSPNPKLLTRQALLITQLLQKETVNGEPALRVWERIYRPTVFFVGKADDLTIYQYMDLARDVFGDNFANVSLDSLADDAKIDQFIAQLDTLPQPRINPDEGLGLRFMGQRFIPDSYIFDNLVTPQVDPRGFPRGLDVMAVLGSERAYQILDQVYEETLNPAYVSQMAKMKQEFAALEAGVWAQNLYWNWLYCLMPLLGDKGEGFPPYMQTLAWRDKELSCALGSWAELRHDTILYAKQSGATTSIPPSKSFAWETVEPNPWAFARLTALCRFTQDGLNSLNLLLEDFKGRLQELESLSLLLQSAAEKELTNRPLTVEEKRAIRQIGPTLERLLTFSGLDQAPAHDMAIVADVHTEYFSGQVLEVGVGRPLNLYVVVNAGDRLLVTMGAAFSYYEFHWPMDDRLTDEAWRKILAEGPVPEFQSWMSSFMDIAAAPKPYQPSKIQSHGSGWEGQVVASVSPEAPVQGDVVRVEVQVRSYAPVEDLRIEVLAGDSLQVIPLTRNGNTGDTFDYYADIPTNELPIGQPVKITVFSPSRLALNSTASFTLQGGATVKEWREW